jgi:hypothetical protein
MVLCRTAVSRDSSRCNQTVLRSAIPHMTNAKLLALGWALSVSLVFHPSPFFGAEMPVDFSGVWQQDVSRSVPQRKSKGAREMKIQQIGRMLAIKITANTNKGTRTLDLKYEIGGQELIYTGLDGDEFHTKVRWDGASLVFDTVEHERGRQIMSNQTWTLANGGAALREVKQVRDAEEPAESVAIYEKTQQAPKE